MYDGIGLAHLSYALLPENQRIDSNKYCSQLDQLKPALDTKCPELVNRKHIIFHQDNIRVNVSLMTRQKLGARTLVPWEKSYDKPRKPLLKSRDLTLPTKVCIVRVMVFPHILYLRLLQANIKRLSMSITNTVS